ncbi:hypothetical protein [Ekhidna sp.]|uniref:hypothetical protein n=1 Tax=Ekhidna sp. TaxID=2608089 RepID=UPI003BAD138A
MLVVPLVSFSQTKIAVPSTTMQFEDIRMPKKQRINTKRIARYKSKKLNDLNRLVKKHTNLPKEKLNEYRLVFQGLDSGELELIYSEINQLSNSNLYPDYSKEINTYNRLSEYNKDSLKSLKASELNKIKSYRQNIPNKYNKSILIDSSDFQKFYQLPDSSVLTSQIPNYEGYIKRDGLDSLGQFERPILSDSIIKRDIERRLETFVSEKVDAGRLNEFNTQPATPKQQVQHYVPSLEKFNYQKPQIPEKKLSKALLEQEKERRKQELLDQLNPNSAEEYADKVTVLSRFSIGGYMRYDAAKNALEFTPLITYSPLQKVAIGIGYQTNISLQSSDSLNTQGWRAFAQYTFFFTYYLHAESEWVKRNSAFENMPATTERNTYAGIGRSFRYKFIRSSITALYNFNAPSDLRTKKFTLRLGLTINK